MMSMNMYTAKYSACLKPTSSACHLALLKQRKNWMETVQRTRSRQQQKPIKLDPATLSKTQFNRALAELISDEVGTLKNDQRCLLLLVAVHMYLNLF
jgi:hypothetical protein